MVIEALALTVGKFLLPHLSSFLSAAAPELGKKTPEWISNIWGKLKPKIETKESAKEAAHDAAKDENDADAAAAFRVQLRKILEADPTLAAEISAIVEKESEPGGSIHQEINAGDFSAVVAVAGDNSGSITATTGKKEP